MTERRRAALPRTAVMLPSPNSSAAAAPPEVFRNLPSQGRTSDLGKSCSHLLSLGAAFPEILEASAELATAQGDDGVGALDGPVHACSLEPRPNYDFATRLHDAGRSTEALFFELGIPHAPSISPDVLNTFSRLFVSTDVAAQRVHQGFQVTFVKLVTTCIDPCLALGAVSINDLSHFPEMFFGMKAIENLSGWREQFGSRVPNPRRASAQHHLPQRFGETHAAGVALYAHGP